VLPGDVVFTDEVLPGDIEVLPGDVEVLPGDVEVLPGDVELELPAPFALLLPGLWDLCLWPLPD
jgi:hypothetical protein